MNAVYCILYVLLRILLYTKRCRLLRGITIEIRLRLTFQRIYLSDVSGRVGVYVVYENSCR